MSYDMDFSQGEKMFKTDDLNSPLGGFVAMSPCFVVLSPDTEAMSPCKEALFPEKRHFLAENAGCSIGWHRCC